VRKVGTALASSQSRQAANRKAATREVLGIAMQLGHVCQVSIAARVGLRAGQDLLDEQRRPLEAGQELSLCALQNSLLHRGTFALLSTQSYA